ncbi:hypothetical protein OY671_007596, partial [Metschnikowia pulcherrima]
KSELAQYREMAAFAQFGSDLDASTQKSLNRGARSTELLKQPQFSPSGFEEQTCVLFAGTQGYLDAVPTNRVTEYEAESLSFSRTSHADSLGSIRDTKDSGDEAKGKSVAALDAFAKQFA